MIVIPLHEPQEGRLLEILKTISEREEDDPLMQR